MKKIVKISLSNDPEIRTRSVLNEDTDEIIEDKQNRPFITGQSSMLRVIFDDNTELFIYAPKDYIFDGATIPFKIGKGNMKILIPALFHDRMCEDKALINYNRQLSSDIFYESLLFCHNSKIVAKTMYFFVNNYQKFMDWREK